MLKLCAHKNRRAVTYYGHGINEKDFLRANELIRQVLAGHPSMTKDILLSRLAERGLTGDPHAMSIYLRRAELDGIACSGKLDDKIIAVPFSDPTYRNIRSIDELPPHIFDEIMHFFSVYKQLENKQTAVKTLFNYNEAIEIVKSAIEAYEKMFDEPSDPQRT